MKRKRKESSIDRFVGKEVILTPLNKHAENRVREYGNEFTITKVIKGIKTRYQVTNKAKNYQRWVDLENDKFFDVRLKQ